MNRRELLQLSVFSVAGAAAAQDKEREKFPVPAPFEWAGKSVKALQAEMKSGQLTSAQLTEGYVKRIEQLKPLLHAVLEVNPDALPTAEALDKERKEKGAARGPLHGIPVLVKDNIDTGDKLQTTAGSLALVGTPAKSDAFVVKKLRDAGAVILGKANMSEWANIRSTGATSGWSARGGQCRNPFALDRSPIGSSSGSAAALAADLTTLALGTETNGSIICPASATGLVGLKPTVGLVSRSGVIPISPSQDTVGPMGRSVEDVAYLLGALTAFDPEDLAMRGAGRKAEDDYLKALDKDGLKGKRLGVVRAQFAQGVQLARVRDAALKELEKLGATLVDVELPAMDDAAQMEVLLTELKAGLDEYLKKRRPDAQVKSLADVIAFNEKNADREMVFFTQDLLEQAQKKGPLTNPGYKKALEAGRRRARKEGIDAVMVKSRLDALVAGALGPAWLIDPLLGDASVSGMSGCSTPAIAGYPSLTVPMGLVGGLPVGLLFFGAPFSEALLLKLGYAYEQAAGHRFVPTFAATATPKF
ncbi:MAG: amidase [Archangiaceae bacterium]|nr:amidase [Archangiaceae bacterium]